MYDIRPARENRMLEAQIVTSPQKKKLAYIKAKKNAGAKKKAHVATKAVVTTHE